PHFFLLSLRRPPSATLFPYTTLFRSTVLRVLRFQGCLSLRFREHSRGEIARNRSIRQRFEHRIQRRLSLPLAFDFTVCCEPFLQFPLFRLGQFPAPANLNEPLEHRIIR